MSKHFTLKCCPFCGGEPKHNDGGNSVFGRLWWAVWCDECQFEFRDRERWSYTDRVMLDPAYPPMECFDRWNMRASTFSTDLSQAPRDGSPVILALNGKTFKSYWCKPQIDPPHWCFLSHKQTPEAWMPWPEYRGHAEAPAMEAAE